MDPRERVGFPSCVRWRRPDQPPRAVTANPARDVNSRNAFLHSPEAGGPGPRCQQVGFILSILPGLQLPPTRLTWPFCCVCLCRNLLFLKAASHSGSAHRWMTSFTCHLAKGAFSNTVPFCDGARIQYPFRGDTTQPIPDCHLSLLRC